MAISGKNTALGHTLPAALPPFYSLPVSPAPSFPLASLVTTPLSFLRQHYTSYWFQPVLNLDQPSFCPLCVSFPPRTLGLRYTGVLLGRQGYS